MKKRLERQAAAWQRERCAELQASIYIQERLLASTQHDLAKLAALRGEELTARFGWESPAEVEKLMAHTDSWLLQLGQLWVENIGRKPNHATHTGNTESTGTREPGRLRNAG